MRPKRVIKRRRGQAKGPPYPVEAARTVVVEGGRRQGRTLAAEHDQMVREAADYGHAILCASTIGETSTMPELCRALRILEFVKANPRLLLGLLSSDHVEVHLKRVRGGLPEGAIFGGGGGEPSSPRRRGRVRG